MTLVQTPRFWGQEFRAGDLVFFFKVFRPIRTSWLIVGIQSFSCLFFATDTRMKIIIEQKKKVNPFSRLEGGKCVFSKSPH